MPVCTACGNHLSTDYLRVCGDDEGALDACPHCPTNRPRRSRRTTPDEPGPSKAENDGNGRNAGNGRDSAGEPRPTPTHEPGDDASTEDGEPADSAFTVKTAGRSLDWPRGSSDVERSRTERSPERSNSTGPNDGSRSSRNRFHATLSTVLDAFR